MIDLKKIESDMKNSIVHLISKLDGLRSSRVSPNFLDNVEVDQHGAKVLLKHLALVSVLDHSSLKIDLFDQSLSGQVKLAIREKLQLDALDMGSGLKVSVPPMTPERRKALVKQAAEYVEEGKVVVRNLRRNGYDNVKSMKKTDNISEDDEKRYQKDIDKLHDHFVKEIDELFKVKEKAILG